MRAAYISSISYSSPSPHRFYCCKGWLPCLYPPFWSAFLANSSLPCKSNWQEKTSGEASPVALSCTIKPEAALEMRKPNRGKKRDGCAMAKWFQPFFLLAAKFMCAPGAIKAEQNTSSARRNIPQLEPQNIRESILDFIALFSEINPDMPYLCRRGQSGLKKAVFASFPSVRRESIKKH